MFLLVNDCYEYKGNKLSDNVVYIEKYSIDKNNEEEKIAHPGIFKEVNISPKCLY